jgi:hypothetical protein
MSSRLYLLIHSYGISSGIPALAGEAEIFRLDLLWSVSGIIALGQKSPRPRGFWISF